MVHETRKRFVDCPAGALSLVLDGENLRRPEAIPTAVLMASILVIGFGATTTWKGLYYILVVVGREETTSSVDLRGVLVTSYVSQV